MKFGFYINTNLSKLQQCLQEHKVNASKSHSLNLLKSAKEARTLGEK
ncbi:hypothetical protein ND16A_3544 [Thalassotalea sp. ND16A]|nr:hypothetical protein ND16A_3544 [Thalassotalea sp. ND16A]